MREPAYFLPAVIAIAKDAGQAILDIYRTNYQTNTKSDNTPVTDADIKADEIIQHALGALAPKIPMLSEESDRPDFATRGRWSTYWLVDPLDGTREFINKTGEFTVNIALIKHRRPVLGVVYAPDLNVLYYAHAGGGAYRVAHDADAEQIHTKAINPSSIIATASVRAQQSDRLQAYLSQFQSVEFFSIGSSLKTCLVADGTADVYPRFGPTSEWDTAAAQCILEESGGHIFDCDFRPLRYNQKDNLLNPYFLAVGDAQFDWRTPPMP